MPAQKVNNAMDESTPDVTSDPTPVEDLGNLSRQSSVAEQGSISGVTPSAPGALDPDVSDPGVSDTGVSEPVAPEFAVSEPTSPSAELDESKGVAHSVRATATVSDRDSPVDSITSAVAAGVAVSGSARDSARSVSQLEEEGEIAADYIEELLDITDLDGDIDIDARDGRAYLSVNSSKDSNLRLLSKPETVNALQELTRIAVQAKTGVFSRLILDVGGSRQTREAELGLLVDRAAERLETGAQSAALPPMSSYERKLVHDLVSEKGLTSQSEGEGSDRHTVITRA